MKKSILIIAALFSFAILFIGCKETKKEEVKEEVKIDSHEGHDHEEGEMTLSVYQCPMDCEKGKTYEVAGTCPVCKMDLKEISNETAHVEGCTCVASGECKCDGGKCICINDLSANECTKCEPGKCICNGEMVSNVKETSNCASGKCACKA